MSFDFKRFGRIFTGRTRHGKGGLNRHLWDWGVVAVVIVLVANRQLEPIPLVVFFCRWSLGLALCRVVGVPRDGLAPSAVHAYIPSSLFCPVVWHLFSSPGSVGIAGRVRASSGWSRGGFIDHNRACAFERNITVDKSS